MCRRTQTNGNIYVERLFFFSVHIYTHKTQKGEQGMCAREGHFLATWWPGVHGNMWYWSKRLQWKSNTTNEVFCKSVIFLFFLSNRRTYTCEGCKELHDLVISCIITDPEKGRRCVWVGQMKRIKQRTGQERGWDRCGGEETGREVRWGRSRPGVEIESGCWGWSRSEIDHLREQSVINGSPQIRGLWPYLGMC